MSAPETKKAPLFSARSLAFAAAVLVAGGAVAAMSAGGEPQHRQKFDVGRADHPAVTAPELAAWGIEGRRDYVLVDLRPSEDFKEGHIRGAVSCGTCHASADEGKKADQGEAFVDLTKKLVLYTETGAEKVKLPKLLADNPRLYILAGGYEAWKNQVMTPVSFGGETDEAQVLAKQKHEAVRAFYAGERPASGKNAVLPVAPIKREGAHAPAKPSEGC